MTNQLSTASQTPTLAPTLTASTTISDLVSAGNTKGLDSTKVTITEYVDYS